MPDIFGLLIAGFGSIDTTEGTSSRDFIPLLNPNVEVLFGVNSWLSLGGSLAVGYASAESVLDTSGVVNKSMKTLYPTLTFAAQTQYFSSGRFAMYGSWGLGVMAVYAQQRSQEEGVGNNTSFAATLMGNAYPLCFSYGNTGEVAGFVELGWGAKGIVNVGIRF